MALVDSLLSAIVRAEGEALVMHVGERPYVVVGTQTINISTHGLNLEAMTGMLSQLLPAEALSQLEEFGAVEYRVPPQGEDRFTVVAARGGDDIWIEIRRRRASVKVPEAPSAQTSRQVLADFIAEAEPIIEYTPPPPMPEAVAASIPEPITEPIAEPIPKPEPIANPVYDPIEETHAEPLVAAAAVSEEPERLKVAAMERESLPSSRS